MFENLLADFVQPMRSMPIEVAALRLCAAVVLGGAIGLERELAARPAGLRTHMMIALAAALLTLVTFELLALPGMAAHATQSDPMQLIAAVTAGVAFLAAGTIFTSKGEVSGLTTGAGMWLAGAVGLACGIGRLPLAGMATVIAIVILTVISYMTARIRTTPPPADTAG